MKLDQALEMIQDELHAACNCNPDWPTDPIHAAAIVSEEAGELTQASLDDTYPSSNHHGKDTHARMEQEAIQTAAMAIRFLLNMPYGEERVRDFNTHGYGY